MSLWTGIRSLWERAKAKFRPYDKGKIGDEQNAAEYGGTPPDGARKKKHGKRDRLRFPVYCKLHGVKKQLRQGSLAQSRAGDGLQLVHVPLQDYPHNVYAYSIPLNRILGYLEQELAERLVEELGEGFCVDGRVSELLGGPPDYKYFGCKICIFKETTLMQNVENFSHLHGES